MSNIEWTDQTWNPVIGCTPVSPGCLNCYAATMANRLQAMGQTNYVGLTVKRGGFKVVESAENVGGPRGGVAVTDHRKRVVFSGKVRTLPDRLMEPLSWKKPRRVFVNSMSDLFHEDVPFEFIDQVFAVMALCPQHTFQVLTKRPERMAEYFRSIADEDDVGGCGGMMRLGTAAGTMLDGSWVWGEGKKHRTAIEHFISDTYEVDDEESGYEAQEVPWPLPNVWLGTSIEQQPQAKRVWDLFKCPAAVRFVSIEPMIGPVDLDAVEALYAAWIDRKPTMGIYLDWVIVGGESGANARACDVEWIRKIVKQCRVSKTPVFVKQLGALVGEAAPAQTQRWPDGTQVSPFEDGVRYWLKNKKGGNPSEWPEDLRVREFPVVRS